MRELQVKNEEAGQRLDKYLSRYLNKAQKSFLYKMLRKKNITLNGSKAAGSEKLQAGDTIRLFLSDETIQNFSDTASFSGSHGTSSGKAGTGTAAGSSFAKPSAKIPALQVLYEDNDVIFLNKPAGMLSQKAAASDYSINEQLLDYLAGARSFDAASFTGVKPSVCNRLDRNTSGLIAAGKSVRGLQELSQMIRERSVRKFYYAIVAGKVLHPVHLKGFLVKDAASNQVRILKDPQPGADPIETRYEPVFHTVSSEYPSLTLLKVELITGKSHQIRAHLAQNGFPILGDTKYGMTPEGKRLTRLYHAPRQMLHAAWMEFPESTDSLSGISGRCIYAPIPADFKKIIRKIEENQTWQPGIPEDFGAQPWKN